VEDDEDVLALVHPLLADGRTGVRRQVLEAGRVGRRGGDDGRVLQGAVLLQRAAHAGDGGALLADGDVDAADLLLRVARAPVVALVDDRVDGQGGLARLAVTDDQLTLTAADRGHRVDGLVAGLHRLVHRLALHDRGGLQFQRAPAVGLDLAEAVDRVAERVDDAAEVALAHRDGEDLAGAGDRLTLLDAAELAEDDGTDLALLEVEGEAEGAVLELQQFVGHGRGKTLDLRDAVAGKGDRTDLLARGRVRLVRLDEGLQCVPDLLRPDRELRHLGSLLSLLGPKFHLGFWGRPPETLHPLHGPTRAVVLRMELVLARHAAAGVLESVRDRTVDDLVTDLHPDPSDDLRVDVQ